MKRVALYLVGVFFLLSSFCYAEMSTLNDDTIIYHYEARADIQTPLKNIAEIVSIDYKRSRDEFTKHEILQELSPVIKSRIAEAKKNDVVTLTIKTKIHEYDFNGNFFQTDFKEGTWVPFIDYTYGATFNNVEAISKVPVPIEKAKTFRDILAKSRYGVVIIKAKILNAKERKISLTQRKALELHIINVELKHDSGVTIASKSI